MEKYYVLKTKTGEIIAVVQEKNIVDVKFNDNLRKNKDLVLENISKLEINEIIRNNKEILFITDVKTKEKLKEKLYIKELVEKVKEQLMINKDMDIIIPECAYKYLPEIEKELRISGMTLKNPIRECINDISPLSKFSDKIIEEKNREKKDVYLGRERS